MKFLEGLPEWDNGLRQQLGQSDPTGSCALKPQTGLKRCDSAPREKYITTGLLHEKRRFLDFWCTHRIARDL